MTPAAEVKRRYDRERQRAIAAGTWQRRVPADECAVHVAALRAAGMSAKSIAVAAGVSLPTIAALAWPEHSKAQTWVTASTATAVLAVTDPGLVPPQALVLAVGTQRRLRALAAIGWSLRSLQQMSGVDVSDVLQRRRVHRSTADRVAATYDRVCMTPGPNAAAAARARSAGWAPPLAWDDESIDDPTAAPRWGSRSDDEVDEVAVQAAVDGRDVGLTLAERRLATQRLAQLGLSDRQIASRLGVHVRTITRDRRALGVESRWSA